MNACVCVCWDNLVNMWSDDTIWIDIELTLLFILKDRELQNNGSVKLKKYIIRNYAALYNVIWGLFAMSIIPNFLD